MFFTKDGIIAQIVLEKGQTVNGKLYADEILPEVFSNFMERGEEGPFVTSCSTTTMLRHTRRALLKSISRRNGWKFFPILHIVQTLPLVIFSYFLE